LLGKKDADRCAPEDGDSREEDRDGGKKKKPVWNIGGAR